MPFISLETDHPLNFMSNSTPSASASAGGEFPTGSSTPHGDSSSHYDFASGMNAYGHNSHHPTHHDLYSDPAASAAASVLDEMMGGGRGSSAFPASGSNSSYNAFSYAHHLSMPGVPLTGTHGEDYGVEHGSDGVDYGQFTDPNAPISLHAFTPVMSQKENKKLDDVYRNLFPSFLNPSGQPKIDGDIKSDQISAEDEDMAFFASSTNSLMPQSSKSPRKKSAKNSANKALSSTPRKKKVSKVTDGDSGSGSIEYIECKGPDTVLPSGRANGDRRYICQGQVIHRATFWRHRKRGCPHMHQRPESDSNGHDYAEYQETQHAAPAHVQSQDFSSSSDYQDDYAQAYHSEQAMFGESIPAFGGVFADPNMGLKGIIQSGMQPLYPIARSHGH
jgi:hypothetical protein